MMSIQRMLPIAFAGLVMALPFEALAQSDSGEDRYTMERQGNRFVRLDTRSGQMSVCRLKGEDLVCRLAVDERDAYLKEIDELQAQLDARKSNSEDGYKSEDSAERSPQRERHDREHDDDYAFEQEFDRALDYSARALRRFFDVMRELRDDYDREL